MGNTIWLQIEESADPSGDERDNSIMLQLEKELDALAVKLGVDKPSSFYDYTSLESDFDDDLDEDDSEEQPNNSVWSSSKSGLRSVTALLEELRARPTAVAFPKSASKSHWPAMLIEELEYCRGVLDGAAANDKRFRFLIVG